MNVLSAMPMRTGRLTLLCQPIAVWGQPLTRTIDEEPAIMAFAGAYFWAGSKNGTWNQPTYWFPSSRAPGTGTHIFDQANIDTTSTVQSTGSVELVGLTLGSGAALDIVSSTFDVNGTLTNQGILNVLRAGELAADNLTLTGGGGLVLRGGSVAGSSNGVTFDNSNNTITGYGTIGNSLMSLVNGTSGVIEAISPASSTLTLATGTNTIVNDGQIEAAAGQTLTIGSTIQNNGTVSTIGSGNIVVTGAITGTGTLSIGNGGTIEISGSVASGQMVRFSGQGTLKIDDPNDFQGRINGIQLGDQIVISPEQKLIADAISPSALYLYESNSLNIAFSSESKISIGGVVSGSLLTNYFFHPTSNADGSTTLTLEKGNEVDLAVYGPAARATYGVVGAGITVGIISDSFNSRRGYAGDVADGALPAGVNVLRDSSAGQDEGRAMAQIVHAIAPGASIDFYSAEDSSGHPDENTLDDGVSALQAAGCQIIVDDLSGGSSSDPVIDGAVNAGVLYITAAGNQYPDQIDGRAADPLVLTVAAMNVLAAPAGTSVGGYLLEATEPFSNIGADSSKPNLTAPDGMQTTIAGFDPFFGTSAAGPGAAAVAALVLQEDPNLIGQPLAVDQLLEETAVPFGEPADKMGAGLVDAKTAVAKAASLSTPPPSSGFVINVSYDSSVQALQTTDPALYSDYTNAVQTAVEFYENHITNDLTVNFSFGWGEVAGYQLPATGTGEAGIQEYNPLTYAQLYNSVQSIFKNGSAVQQAALASLPKADPTGGSSILITTPEAAALGLDVPSGSIAGAVGLNSSATNWGWNQSIEVAGQQDAVAVIENQISESLGRFDWAGSDNDYTLLDLFRYTAADGADTDAPGASAGMRDQPFVSGYDSSAPSYFSYDGEHLTLLYNPLNAGDWDPSVSNDAFADDVADGADLVSGTDLEELEVAGYSIACYCHGTMILTADGEVPVEDLAIGDLLLTLSSEARAIRWIGRRSYNGRFVAGNRDVLPICITRDSMTKGVPARDLWVSPEHSLYIDDVLVQAKHLVNGVTVVQAESVEELEYFHIELETHDVIYADGMAAETFVDCDNRLMFGNGREYARLYPDDERPRWQFCAPRLEWGSSQLAAIRGWMFERARGLADALPDDPGLEIVVDGAIVSPIEISGSLYRFELTGSKGAVWLRSRSFIPAETDPGSFDTRRLGVPVREIVLASNEQSLKIQHWNPALRQGFHDREKTHRWTNGMARIPDAMLSAFGGPITVTVRLSADAHSIRTTPGRFAA